MAPIVAVTARVWFRVNSTRPWKDLVPASIEKLQRIGWSRRCLSYGS